MSRAFLLVLLGAACTPPPPSAVVTARAAYGSGLDLSQARWTPRGLVSSAHAPSPLQLELTLAPGAQGSIELDVPAACPVEIELPPSGEAREVEVKPWIALGDDRPQVGFDAPFRIEVTPGCRQAVAGGVRWTQLSGPSLGPLEVRKNGFELHARTAPRDDAPLPWGVVPFSPRTRQCVVLEATWSGAGRADVVRTLRVCPVARATGVPSLAVGQRVLLGGEGGWRVTAGPEQSTSQVVRVGGVDTFLPDRSGRWDLVDALGRTLGIRARRHDRTRLDCARSGCHPHESEHASKTSMTTVFQRGLEGELGADYDPGCALECHTAGEPGLPDGGFSHVARTLHTDVHSRGAPGAWSSLPRVLRRLGAVGCTTCHGPGFIPEHDARWSILRVDVCATCHDAPPRYPLVEQWRAGRMARADAVDGATAQACAGCHTTARFLHDIGARSLRDGGTPPQQVDPIGITCAACHAPHAAEHDGALVRRIEDPRFPEFTGATGICVPCHATDAAGRGPTTVEMLRGVPGLGPHARLQDGCLSCHAPTDHSFRADRSRCQRCHNEKTPDASLRTRALAAWKRLGGDDPSAHPAPAKSEVLRGLRLVLGDRAAAVHNAPYARSLVNAAQR